jgi:ABC-2 type transport system permease protein
MPIFDQGYQHWQGKLSGHAWRWLTITRRGVRAQWTSRWVRVVLLLAWLPALALILVLVFWGLFEQQAEMVMPIIQFFRLPKEMMAGPHAFRTTVWTLAYEYFFQFEMFFAMILVLLVGPNLISQDLRFNALPLYFSRPLRRIDYFVGKLGVIATFLGAVAVVPAVLAYVLGVVFSLDLGVIRDTAHLLPAALGYGLLIVLSAGTLMLALSSLSRNSRYIGALWVGVWFVSSGLATVLSIIHRESAFWETYRRERPSQQVGRVRPGEPAPGARLGPRGRPRLPRPDSAMIAVNQRAIERAQDARLEAMREDWGPLFSYTANLHRIGTGLLDTDAAWAQLGRLADPRAPERVAANMGAPLYPWYWSAGVLAFLMGLSVWILTSRVKSLDRLR